VTFCLVLLFASSAHKTLGPLAKAADGKKMERTVATEAQAALHPSELAPPDVALERPKWPPDPEVPESSNRPPDSDLESESPSLPPAAGVAAENPTLEQVPTVAPAGPKLPSVAPPAQPWQEGPLRSPAPSAQAMTARPPCRDAVRRSPSAPSKQNQVFKSSKVTVTVTIERKTFLVQGCTQGELATSAVNNIPGSKEKSHAPTEGAIGMTVPSLSYQWSVDSKPSSCMMASASVVFAIVVYIPEATTREGMSSAEWRKWDLLVSKIKTHEQRHVDIFIQGAKGLPQALEGVRASRNCGDVEKSIHAAINKVNSEMDRRNANFEAQDEPMIVD